MASVSRIVQLAHQISESVARIDKVLTVKGIPTPSFDEDAPLLSLPEQVRDDQDIVIDAAMELHDLLINPVQLIKAQAGTYEPICLQAISRYNIAALVPPSGKVSFTSLAQQTKFDEQLLTRLLRQAITMRIFCEPEPGFLSHTQASKLLADPQHAAWLAVNLGELMPPSHRLLDALEKWPGSQEPSETAYALHRAATAGANQSLYDVLGTNPTLGARFAAGMAVSTNRPDSSPLYLATGYDWASLSLLDRNNNSSSSSVNPRRVRVVDVGGSRGHVASALAAAHPHLDVLVQDMEEVIAGAEAALPAGQQGRVAFMAHDLFAPQPVVGADVYLFRWILHNWGDRYCLEILRAQVPALRAGASVLIMEVCMPEPVPVCSDGDGDGDGNGKRKIKTPLWKEKELRNLDLTMAALFNARERTLREWKALFAEADRRFEFVGVHEPKGSRLAILEVRWSP